MPRERQFPYGFGQRHGRVQAPFGRRRSECGVKAVAPFFIVADLERAERFYTQQLGFQVRYSAPQESPFCAIVGRDGAQVAEFGSRGVSLHRQLADDDDNDLRGFEVADSDGYVLYFGRPR